jgi:hypothetical protein
MDYLLASLALVEFNRGELVELRTGGILASLLWRDTLGPGFEKGGQISRVAIHGSIESA